MRRLTRMARTGMGILLGATLAIGTTRAQVTPAAGYTPPDDTPTVKVGTTIFADYTYTDEPTALDADGNTINPASFNIGRAYINITGNINHLVSYRVTPDITRFTTTGASTTLDGSYTFRLKYAYGQFNLDQAWTKGSWVRFGQHHTPYVDWEEGIYRYRFQGQIFMEKEGFMSSADVGVSAHYNLPGNYGDLHLGYYNGDTYTKAEPNDQKAVQGRVSFRPVPMSGALKGLRLTAFYDADHYVKNDDRTRFIYTVTFEHKYLNAGFEHLDATDQSTAVATKVKANGYSVWATPKLPKNWELLLRYDNLKPDKTVDATKDRKIGGVAYWFTSQQPGTTAAVLLDYEAVTYDTALGKPDEKRYALHTLFSF
jgi:hypothetical protein